QKAVECTPSGHADLPLWLGSLGISYSHHFEHTGKVEDIEQAIFHLQKAVECTPSGHADLPIWLNNLAKSYLHHFEHTGKVKDIEQAIFHHHKAVECTPSGQADLPIHLHKLGNSYLHCFEHTGKVEDIERAIFHHQKAVELTPAGHADLPRRLGILGFSYSCCFEHTGKVEDIEQAIFHLQKAIECTPSGHADLPRWLSWLGDLGTAYLRHFEHTGKVEDIEQAIFHHQKAVELTPSGHADLPSWLGSLGTSYSHRFRYTGKVDDIEQAIFHQQKAVECTPSGHADLPGWLGSLGNSYSRYFAHTGKVEDIEKAIFHQQKAVECTPAGHAHLPRWLGNLGTSYSSCFEHTGKVEDIEQAIFHLQKAVKFTPAGNAHLPIWLGNLGTSYSYHFEHTGKVEDIEKAIFHLQKAVECTPSGHAYLPHWLINLAKSYLHRFKHTGKQEDVKSTIELYRRATVANGIPSRCLTAAKDVAILSSIHDRLYCLNDFSVAISLLSEVAGLEQTIPQRHAHLHGQSKFVALAVATALNLGRTDLALEWLENGRCLVWNQLNQLRAPIENLKIHHQSMAHEFIQVASALESYGTRSVLTLPPSMDILPKNILEQKETCNHTQQAIKYKELLETIRKLPDFHNFLKPPKYTNLLNDLPQDGPIVIFNIHDTQCDALALIAGAEEAVHIPLRKFSLADAENLQKILQVDILKQREASDEERLNAHRKKSNTVLPDMSCVLQELWLKVVKPILEALAYALPSTPSNRCRIWWCPTGPLAFLPLHAAGIYGSDCPPGSCVSDFVVSSYTPTVRLINDKCAASATLSKDTKLLVVSQPNTPGLRPIYFTTEETNKLQTIMNETPHVDTLLLKDSDATIDRVKTEMQSHNWIHFSCHGIQDRKNPLNSGVHLHNGRLELLEIIKQKLQNHKLAFLSACQTSKGDSKLSEEAVHLAAGMLAAGYCGVIGTMWSISDFHGPQFAQAFYEYLLNKTKSEGLNSNHAAYALDYATSKVRKTLGHDDRAFLIWVPYVHFGY
ncbi:hypothetical protein HYPSUDRAFT_1070996, partial [Hypholoma sublateritium FD-334 SS-4]